MIQDNIVLRVAEVFQAAGILTDEQTRDVLKTEFELQRELSPLPGEWSARFYSILETVRAEYGAYG